MYGAYRDALDAERGGKPTTHVPTWDGLVDLLGRTDFLHVADSKLCSRAAMGHIAGRGGRFVTILPGSRAEDGAFREHLQTHTPTWIEAARRRGTRLGDPDEVYCTTPAPLPSSEGYRIVWAHSTAKASRDGATRTARLEAGVSALEALDVKLAGPRSRFKTRVAVEQAATTAVADAQRAGARALVLNHLAPGNNEDTRWEQAQVGFNGVFVVGQDMMQVGLQTTGS